LLVHRTLRRRHKLNRTPGADRNAPHLSTMESSKPGAPRIVSGAGSAKHGGRS
jgi:hypothetical protein